MKKNYVLTVLLAFILIISFGCKSQKWKDSFEGGTHIALEVETKGDSYIDEKNTAQTVEIIKKRFKALRIKKSKWVIKSTGDRTIIIQSPNLKDPQKLINLATKVFQLEFKLLDDESPVAAQLPEFILPGEEKELIQEFASKIPEDDEILFGNVIDEETKKVIRERVYLMKKQALMTGEYLTDAGVSFDNLYNEPYVSMVFDSEGRKLFEQITEANVNKQLAIILDDNVYSAPRIKEKISGGRAQIHGAFTLEEAKDIAATLKAGALPAPVKVMEVRKLTKDLWLGK